MTKRLTFFFTFLLIVVLHSALFAQTQEQKAALMEISQKAEVQSKADRIEAEALALKMDIPIRYTTQDGVTMELQKIENGIPVYYATDNSLSSQTISTNKTYIDQSGGFSLSGAGQNLGVWDAGAILHSHQEFQGRSSQKDGAVTTHYHATHVAGTMIAGGVDSRAKGMSYGGTLNAYDWNNDLGELSAAASSGLKVSSHSYGIPQGWAFDARGDGKWVWYGNVALSTTEDYKFGFYDSYAANWDAMLYNAQNLLVCKSGGNDRGDGPAPGTQHWALINGTWTLSTDARQRDGGTLGFDCIGDGRAVAKNIFTIGAVGGIQGGYLNPQGVTMSSFSSWGPTDDGRIKPDVVTDGVNLYSTTNTGNTAYTVLSGTSMATPSASGAVGILLQQQAALYTSPFKAATLKALIIHTADEAGANDGPDYTFGWGLMNTLNAVKYLSVNAELGTESPLIKENTLNQGGTYEYQVVSNGTEPLKVTIVWNDAPGSVGSPALNDPTLKLINDLDLRIIGPGGTYLPWILDRDNPTVAAAKGDNIRDNVEQVLVPFPAAGNYTVRITHKGNLFNNSQNFSLIVTGIVVDVPNTLSLLLPVNGASDQSTKPYMKWSRASKGLTYQIQVSADPLFAVILSDTVVSSVNYQFNSNLPELSTLYWRVRGINSGGPGVWSDVWNFNTQLAIPEPPVLVIPANSSFNVKNNSSLVWSTDATVSAFKAQVATNVLFTALAFNDSTLTDTTVTMGFLTENKKYYWRVRGKNPAGIGEYSPIYNFTSAVNAPDSLSAELIDETSIKLDWKDKSAVENRFYILRKEGLSGTFALLDSLSSNSVTYTDTGLNYSTTYVYRVFCGANLNYSDSAEVSMNTAVTVENEKELIPDRYTVTQNYPNPFNPSTMIKYGLPSESKVKLVIYNSIGETVGQLINKTQSAGYYEVTWNAQSMPSGIYFYSVEAVPNDGSKSFREVRKMILLK
jgi:trimeric autotransporter adhesin